MSNYYLKGKINIGNKLVHCLADGIWTITNYDKSTKEYSLLWDKDNKTYHYSDEILRQTFGRYIDKGRDLTNDELKSILVEALNKISNNLKKEGKTNV